jgi:hypothetical protein
VPDWHLPNLLALCAQSVGRQSLSNEHGQPVHMSNMHLIAPSASEYHDPPSQAWRMSIMSDGADDDGVQASKLDASTVATTA